MKPSVSDSGYPNAIGPQSSHASAADPATTSEQSLKSLAMRAATITVIGFGTSQMLRMAGNVIVARLLFPSAFGLMLLVGVFTQGLQMLSALSVGPSIIHNKKGTDFDFLNTAWTIQVGRAVILFVMALLCTFPYALFYSEFDLFQLIPFVAAGSLIAGFSPITFATQKKKMDLFQITLIPILAQVVGIIVMVTWALLYRNVWALAVGSVTITISRCILGYILLPNHDHRFRWHREHAKEIIHYSKWILLASIVTFLAMQGDKLILGKIVPMERLGVFSTAISFAMLFNALSSQLQSSVIFPAVAKRQDLPREELRARLIRARWKVLAGAAVLVAIPAVFGDWIIWILYDSRYHDAGWMLCWLSAGKWAHVTFATIRPALGAVGHPEYSSLAFGMRLVMLGIALPIAYCYGGLSAAVITIALADLPVYAGFAYGLYKQRLLAIRQDILMTIWFGIVVVLLLGLKAGLREVL